MGFENLDIALYLNIAFYSVLGIGILIGFIKGFRRSLYTFIITIVFVGVFFLTVNAVVKSLYTLNLSFLGGLLANLSSDLSGVTSIKEAITVLLAQQLEGSLDASLTNPDFIEFVDAIGIFVLKIAYTIIYFTVIQFLYRFILFIVSLFIFRKGRAKNKNGKRTRWAGAIFGFLTAAVNVFVMIIVLSGIMSIGESLVSLQQTEELSYNVELNQPSRDNFSDLTMASNRLNVFNYQELAEENDNNLTTALNSLESMINEYNNNFIIKLTNSVKIEDEVTDEEKSLGIVLFDEVLSIQYKDTNIALRQDLKTFSQVAGIYLNSDFNESKDFADLTSTEVNNVFTTLSQSNLLISIIPIGVEVGADYFDVDLELDKETLYEDIVWREEIQQIGAVASTGFMILESANAFDPDIDYKTVSLDGGDVEDLFDALSESKLVEYGAYLAVEPLLEQASTNIQSVITIPEDLNWKDEFIAFGDIASEILSSGITIADLETGDIQQILTIFSDVNLNVLLESKLTTRALINILSGQTEINMDIDFLVIPDMPYDEWVEYDNLGNVIDGELMRILTSIDILIDNVVNIDFDDVQIDDLTTLSSNEIDNIFESRILVASVTEAIRGLSSDELNLIIPDSVLDEDNYILKAEVKSLFNAITMAAGQLPCDPGDTECEDLGFDINKILSLDSTNVDTLFDSQILFATTSNLIMEYGEDELVIPDDVKTTILVEEANLTIVNETEVKNAFLAISALGLEDLNNIEVDASILTNLAEADVDDPLTSHDETTTLDTNDSAKLFASKILHATISKFIIDEATPEPGVDATLIIPYYATEDYDLSGDDIVRIDDTAGNVEYISEAELTEVLEAILALDISDFSSIENLDIALILENSEEILDSAILHATISDQLIKLDGEGTLTIPKWDDLETYELYETTGSNQEETVFILKSELANTFDALEVLDIDDFNNVTIDASILSNLAEAEVDDPSTPEDETTILDTNKSTKLFASKIIHTTISQVIYDSAEAEVGEEPDLIIPYYATEDYEDTTSDIVRITTSEGDEYISEAELTQLLEAILILDIDDFNNVSDILLSDLIDNLDDLLDSGILHATISKQVIDLAVDNDDIVLPNQDIDGIDIIQIDDLGEDAEFITKIELMNTFNALDLLGDIDDLDSFTGDIDLNIFYESQNPNYDSNQDDLLDSAIFHATISKQITELEGTDLTIPEWDEYETYKLIETVDTTNYIIKTQIKAILNALDALEIYDFDNVTIDASILTKLAVAEVDDPDTNDIDESTTLDTDESDKIFASKIVHATISKIILDAGDETQTLPGEEPDLVVPAEAWETYSDSTLAVKIKNSYGDEYISEAELTELLEAILKLEIDDFEDVSGLLLVDLIENTEDLLDSAILHATISEQISDLEGTELTIPIMDENDTYELEDSVVATYDGNVETTDYIIKDEITAILLALDALEIYDFDNVTIDASILTKLAYEDDPATSEDESTTLNTDKSEKVFASKIVHATISKVIFDATQADPGEEPDLEVPAEASEAYSDSSLAVKIKNSTDDEYISEMELTELFRSILALEITDFNDVNTLLLSDIYDNIEVILESAIFHATISKQISDLEGTDLTIPTEDEYNTYELINSVVVTYDGSVETTDYIIKDEITAILLALDALEIYDFDNVVINASILTKLAVAEVDDPATPLVDESTTLSETKAGYIFDSKIVHATISKVIFDATQADPGEEPDLNVPAEASEAYSDSSLAVKIKNTTDDEYISEMELTELFRSVLALEINDFNDVNTLLLSDIYDNIDVILESAIFHATISKQIIDLEGTELTIPIEDEYNTYELKDSVDSTYDGSVETTNYIIKDEITAILLALDALEIYDFNNVSIDASILTKLAEAEVDDPATPRDETITLSETKAGYIFDSKIVHATISKVIFDATQADPGEEPDLVIPYFATEDYVELDYLGNPSDQVRITNTTSDEYITSLELTQLFEAILILDITDFNVVANFSLNDIIENDDEILDSAILHATISKQVIDLETSSLGEIVVPNKNQEGDDIILVDTSGEDAEFITKTELKNTFTALDLLGGIDNLSGFTGAIDLNMFYESQDPEYDQNQEDLLNSSIMQATISLKLQNLELDNKISIPNYDIYSNQIEFTYGSDYFVEKDEIKNLINVLDIFGLTNMETFGGEFAIASFSSEGDQETLLTSAIMHLTVSDQVLAMSNVNVPMNSLENNLSSEAIRVTPDVDEFIVKTEIKALINVLSLFGSENIDDFSGAFQISTFVDPGNQTLLLESATMHATISEQILDLDNVGTIVAPNKSITESWVRYDMVGSNSYNEYILKSEVINLINGLDLLGANNIDDFDGDLDISGLSSGTDQDKVLDSATLHATFSDNLISIDNAILIVPFYNETGETVGNEIRKTVDITEYIVKDEIKNIITAFLTMNYTSVDQVSSSATGFTLDEFFANPSTVLASSSIQATVSYKLLNETGTALTIPDDDIRVTPNKTITIYQTDVTYIESDELEYLIIGLEELGLNNFSGMSFTPTNVFSANFITVLDSATLQATLSKTLLTDADDGTTPSTSGTLIIPNYFRENITINGLSEEQIEYSEILNLLTGLQTIGVTSFDGSVDPTTVTSLTTGQLNIILNSGSLHVTINNMLQTNGALTIPTFILYDLYGMTDIIETSEIVNFVAAANALGETDISETTFDFDDILLLDSTNQGIVLESAIIRATITPEVETAKSAAEILDPYTGTWEYEADGTTLTKDSIEGVIEQYY